MGASSVTESAPSTGRYRFSEALLYRDEWKTVVGERFKYSFSEEQERGVLFDLVLDPSERFDLVDQKPEVAREMAGILRDWVRGMFDRTGNSVQGEHVVDMEEEVVQQLRELGYIE